MSHGEFLFPSPKYSAFTQSVRRFRPSQLLPVLAEMTVRDDPNYRGFEQVRALPPWIMAAIARESIVRGNEGRTQHATPDDILQLARLHHEVFVEPTRQSLTAIAGPLMHEQMWWQISLFEEQARTLSLFDDPAYGDVFPWEDVLGMTLVDAVKAAFLVGLVVNRNAGRWDESVLDAFYSDPRVEAHISRARVVQTAKLLTITIDDFRSMGRKWDERPDRDPELAKHPLNPLMGYPLVDLGADRIVAPIGPLVWRALLPNGLYVRGRQAWGGQFTNMLGERYEQYVGALLRNVAHDLHGEIRYGKGGGKQSVDWIWVTPQAVVLVECKSAGLSIDALAGGGRFDVLVQRAIVESRRQIDRTAEQIRTRTPGFEAIPADRPIVGIVATSDPFFMANAGLEEYGSMGVTPSMVASVRSIEHLTTRQDAIEVLLRVFGDEERRRWDFEQAIDGAPPGRHPVAEIGWQRVGPLRPPPQP